MFCNQKKTLYSGILQIKPSLAKMLLYGHDWKKEFVIEW